MFIKYVEGRKYTEYMQSERDFHKAEKNPGK